MVDSGLGVFFAIMSGGAGRERLLHALAEGPCNMGAAIDSGSGHPRVWRCAAYTDTELHSALSRMACAQLTETPGCNTQAVWSGRERVLYVRGRIRVVSPLEYCQGGLCKQSKGCTRHLHQRCGGDAVAAALAAPRSPLRGGHARVARRVNGSSGLNGTNGTAPPLHPAALPYFCQPHPLQTLSSQYRFLAALAHASSHVRNTPTRWLLLIDDDSNVRHARLAEALASLDHTRPLYGGDMVVTARSDRVPRPFLESAKAFGVGAYDGSFACGGAGSLFSRGALDRIDFGDCAVRMRRASRCMQSDWAIGRCATAARLTTLDNLSCGTCALGERCSADDVRVSLGRIERGCVFSQFVGGKCSRPAQSLARLEALLPREKAARRFQATRAAVARQGLRVCTASARVAVSHAKCNEARRLVGAPTGASGDGVAGARGDELSGAPIREAIVFMTSLVRGGRELAQCKFLRLHALLASMERNWTLPNATNVTRELVMLYRGEENAGAAALRDAATREYGAPGVRMVEEVRVVRQPELAGLPNTPSFEAYGDERSGRSKPAFVLWLNGTTYDRAWHVEDDVFTQRPWYDVFDRYAPAPDDLVGRFDDVYPGDQFGWRANCYLGPPRCRRAGGDPSADLATCLRLNRTTRTACFGGSGMARTPNAKVYWPVLRFSRRLAAKVVAMLAEGATGHHEALTGAACAFQPWCSQQPLAEEDGNGLVLGGAPHFRAKTSAVGRDDAQFTHIGFRNRLANMRGVSPKSIRSTLLHPVKCEAEGKLGRMGERQLRYTWTFFKLEEERRRWLKVLNVSGGEAGTLWGGRIRTVRAENEARERKLKAQKLANLLANAKAKAKAKKTNLHRAKKKLKPPKLD